MTASLSQERSLHEVIEASPLAIGLLNLPDRRFAALSARARELLGLNAVDLRDFDVLALSGDPGATALAWNLTVDGGLNAYGTRRSLRIRGCETVCDLQLKVVIRCGGSHDAQRLERQARARAADGACSAVVTFAMFRT